MRWRRRRQRVPRLLGVAVAKTQRREEVRVAGADPDGVRDWKILGNQRFALRVNVQRDILGENDHPRVREVDADDLELARFEIAELPRLARRLGQELFDPGMQRLTLCGPPIQL